VEKSIILPLRSGKIGKGKPAADTASALASHKMNKLKSKALQTG
jgi:hypothetical protein